MPDEIKELLKKPMNELEISKEENVSFDLKGAEALEVENTPVVESTTPESVEGGKVSYQRFKKFHDLAKESQREAEFWKQRAMETQMRPEQRQDYYQAPTPKQDIEPVYQGADWENFKSLFAGADENAVKTAYRQEIQRAAAIEERAFQRAQEAFEQRSQSQQQEVRENREFLDEWTDEASDIMGRDLTDDEQVALLDIMDEYSAKDGNGMIVAPLGAEQALRIFEMQNTTAHQARRATRAAIAQTSSGTSGDTTVVAAPQEENKNFDARLGWRANLYRKTGVNLES